MIKSNWIKTAVIYALSLLTLTSAKAILYFSHSNIQTHELLSFISFLTCITLGNSLYNKTLEYDIESNFLMFLNINAFRWNQYALFLLFVILVFCAPFAFFSKDIILTTIIIIWSMHLNLLSLNKKFAVLSLFVISFVFFLFLYKVDLFLVRSITLSMTLVVHFLAIKDCYKIYTA